MEVPSDQKALLLTEAKGSFSIGTIPVPKPGPGEILVKVQATALNPIDWMIQTYDVHVPKYPVVLGFDLAGTVEEVGEGVTRFAVGDGILSMGTIGPPTHATFQQYALASAHIAAKIPSNVSFDEASTLPVCLTTAAVGLYGSSSGIGLTPPWEASGRGKYLGKPIVVLAGSSTVGRSVIQCAKLSGFDPIIATASLHNAEALKELGATHVVDRNLAPEAVRAEIAKITSAPTEIVYDAVSLPDTQNAGYDLLSPGGVLIIVVRNAVDEVRRTGNKRVVGVYGDANAAQNRALATDLYSHLTALLEEGAIKPNRVELLPDGLQGIVSGLEKLKKGAVSNVKLVAHPQEIA